MGMGGTENVDFVGKEIIRYGDQVQAVTRAIDVLEDRTALLKLQSQYLSRHGPKSSIRVIERNSVGNRGQTRTRNTTYSDCCRTMNFVTHTICIKFVHHEFEHRHWLRTRLDEYKRNIQNKNTFNDNHGRSLIPITRIWRKIFGPFRAFTD